MVDKKLVMDEDFFIDVVSSKIPYHAVEIRGIGRGKLNITDDIASLKLPKAAVVKETGHKNEAPPGRGRGELRSIITDRPARLPKGKDTIGGLIGINNPSHFPSLQSASATTSKKSPHSSPKIPARQGICSNPQSLSQSSLSATSSRATDQSWPSLNSLSVSNTKLTDKGTNSFAQIISKESERASTSNPSSAENPSHFSSLRSSIGTTSKKSPHSSPKISARQAKCSNPQSLSPPSLSATSSRATDQSWPSLNSLSVSNTKLTDKGTNSFAQISKESERASTSNPSSAENTTISSGPEVVVIWNLPEEILEEDLKELLQLYGNVVTCNIERDNKGNSLGCALISMETKQECEWIISIFHNEEYPGCTGFGKLSCSFLS